MNPTLDRRGFVARLAALPLLLPGAAAHAAARRDALPLLLALEAPPDVDPAGYLVSEKFDGVRALWDGAVLRLRGGGVVAAPRWFTAGWPSVALDGELWGGRGGFEATSGAVRRHRADDAEWRALRYMVFELPQAPGSYAQRAGRIAALARDARAPGLAAVPQAVLADHAALQRRLDEVLDAGGEGLMLHRADAPYAAGRSDALLKLKPLHDAEAVVVAHEPGQGRHAGRLGALRVRTPGGVEFSIGTGLSDAERAAPPPVGSVVTYRHRGSTAAGVPRAASFLRRWPAS